MICTDCIHYEVCSQFSKTDGANHEYYTYANQSEKCECFKDKSKLIQLPCKPLPVLQDSNPCNTDVYCPSCGENLSGYYVESRIDVVVCFNCGELLDITKAVEKKPDEKGG